MSMLVERGLSIGIAESSELKFVFGSLLYYALVAYFIS